MHKNKTRYLAQSRRQTREGAGNTLRRQTFWRGNDVVLYCARASYWRGRARCRDHIRPEPRLTRSRRDTCPLRNREYLDSGHRYGQFQRSGGRIIFVGGSSVRAESGGSLRAAARRTVYGSDAIWRHRRLRDHGGTAGAGDRHRRTSPTSLTSPVSTIQQRPSGKLTPWVSHRVRLPLLLSGHLLLSFRGRLPPLLPCSL